MIEFQNVLKTDLLKKPNKEEVTLTVYHSATLTSCLNPVSSKILFGCLNSDYDNP